MDRRTFLKYTSGLTALAGLPYPLQADQSGPPTSHWVLQAKESQAQLLQAGKPTTQVWAYNGQIPGPTIYARQGKPLAITLLNGLPQVTSVHWHGLRIANAMDGAAGLTQDPVASGDEFTYRFTPPDAGTYWYHTHFRSFEQMARGLYGPLIVQEAEPPRVDQDLLFVIDDWRLDNDGQIHSASFGNMHDHAHNGRLGNWSTVNGHPEPTFEVTSGQRIRLRTINTANSRIMRLNLTPHQARIIAFDGQPITPQQVPDKGLVLGPGQRADLILDMMLEPGSVAAINAVSRNEFVTVAHFAYHASKRARTEILDASIALPHNPLRQNLDLANALSVPLVMSGGAMGAMQSARYQGKEMGIRELVQAGMAWSFNGVVGMSETPLARFRRGQTALIDIHNDNRWTHAMHVHGHHFRVVARNQKEVKSSPWRDTVLIDPGERLQIAFVADNPGKWLLHCHMLEHMASGMVTWLEVS